MGVCARTRHPFFPRQILNLNIFSIIFFKFDTLNPSWPDELHTATHEAHGDSAPKRPGNLDRSNVRPQVLKDKLKYAARINRGLKSTNRPG